MGFEAACKIEARSRHWLQDEVIRLRAALEEIERTEYWRGVRMQEVAKEALCKRPQ